MFDVCKKLIKKQPIQNTISVYVRRETQSTNNMFELCKKNHAEYQQCVCNKGDTEYQQYV